MRTTFAKSGGGAVPGFFFRPLRFALSCVPLTRTSQVGGNSIGHGVDVGLMNWPGGV